jgi:hypothetical protein
MSNSIVRDAIAAGIAATVRVVDAPVLPLGYGSDLSCADDFAESMDEVDGNSLLALAQALFHRLDCPRGRLPDDDDYGLDLRAMVNTGMTARQVRELGGAIRSELAKDDRVADNVATVTPNATGSELTIDLAVTPVDISLGPFSMTLSVTSAEILLLAVRQ